PRGPGTRACARARDLDRSAPVEYDMGHTGCPGMQIGVLGSGVVGRALGRGWATHGHQVVLGSGSPARPELQQWAAETGQAVADFGDAARSGELVALALLGTATIDVLEQVGPDALAGKVVIDATNPLT